MPRPLKRGILGASSIILFKDIDKYAFICGSNFYETDVIMSYKTLNDLNILVKQGYNLAKNLKTQFWKN